MQRGRGITGNGVEPPSRSIARSASLPVRILKPDLRTGGVDTAGEPARPDSPPSVQLDAGTRLWISLKSLAQLPSGDFEFWGTLLLPVEHAGVVLLERDTGIRGTGKRNKGRISLRVVELTIRGTHYELKNANDTANAPNAETSGRGGVVEFSADQIFEMFMSSRAAYAK